MGKRIRKGEHHHHEHRHVEGDDDKVENKILSYLKSFKSKVMETLNQIKEELAGLKSDITEERAEVKTKIDELIAKVDELTANVEAGGTEEVRQAILADIKTLRDEVKTIFVKAEEGGGGTGEEV